MNPREELLKRATDIVLHGRTITYPSISSAEEVRNVMAELVVALRETSSLVGWVETWASNPAASYSTAALDGLFGMTRDKIAALSRS